MSSCANQRTRFKSNRCYGLPSPWHSMAFSEWPNSLTFNGVMHYSHWTTSPYPYTSLKQTPLDVVAQLRYSKLTHLHVHTMPLPTTIKWVVMWPLLRLYIKRADSIFCHAQQSRTPSSNSSNKLGLTTHIIRHIVSVLGLPPLQLLPDFQHD